MIPRGCNRRYPAILLLLLICGAAPALSHGWRVTMLDGTVFYEVALDSLRGDSLAISGSGPRMHGGPRAIHADSIAELRLVQGTYVGTGLLIGGVTGMGGGAALGHFTSEPGDVGIGRALFIILGGVAGGLSGAMIGSNFNDDEVYDLSRMSHEFRLATIRTILVVEE